MALNYGSKRMGAVDKLLHQIKSVVDAIPEKAGLKVWLPLCAGRCCAVADWRRR